MSTTRDRITSLTIVAGVLVALAGAAGVGGAWGPQERLVEGEGISMDVQVEEAGDTGPVVAGWSQQWAGTVTIEDGVAAEVGLDVQADATGDLAEVLHVTVEAGGTVVLDAPLADAIADDAAPLGVLQPGESVDYSVALTAVGGDIPAGDIVPAWMLVAEQERGAG